MTKGRIKTLMSDMEIYQELTIVSMGYTPYSFTVAPHSAGLRSLA